MTNLSSQQEIEDEYLFSDESGASSADEQEYQDMISEWELSDSENEENAIFDEVLNDVPDTVLDYVKNFDGNIELNWLNLKADLGIRNFIIKYNLLA